MRLTAFRCCSCTTMRARALPRFAKSENRNSRTSRRYRCWTGLGRRRPSRPNVRLHDNITFASLPITQKTYRKEGKPLIVHGRVQAKSFRMDGNDKLAAVETTDPVLECRSVERRFG